MYFYIIIIIAQRHLFVNRSPPYCSLSPSKKHAPIKSQSARFYILNFFIFFKKPIDKSDEICYNMQVVKARPIGQAVKTLASHAGNSGSIPGWVTTNNLNRMIRFRLFFFLSQSVFRW